MGLCTECLDPRFRGEEEYKSRGRKEFIEVKKNRIVRLEMIETNNAVAKSLRCKKELFLLQTIPW